MPASGRIFVDEEATKALERGALHVYAQHVVKVEAQAGEWVEIVGVGRTLGFGFFNPRSSIPVKLFTWEDIPPEEYVAKRLEEAYRRKRRRYGDVFRWVFAEGDLVPGLLIDLFSDIAVVRTSVLGLEKVLDTVVEIVGERVDHILLKNKGAGLKREGIEERVVFLRGGKERTKISEGDVVFLVDVVNGHKTGFYLDQRENRLELERWVGSGDRVLDLFAYTGGFGIHAGIRGANVTFVELGKKNVEILRENMRLNGVEGVVVQGDALTFLKRTKERFNVVILDPPALIRENKEGGKRMYFKLNRLALRVVEAGGLFVSCSCSQPLTPKEFIGILRGAAEREGRRIRMLGGVRGQAGDHTVYLPQPETLYLKCVFGVVE